MTMTGSLSLSDANNPIDGFPHTVKSLPAVTPGGMFMATYTENYQLHQWVPEDDFLRTDFNTDFQKIDAALGALKTLAEGKAGQGDLDALESAIASVQTLANGRARIITGSYTGNIDVPRTVSTGVTPKVLVITANDSSYVAIQGGTAVNSVIITTGGFTIQSNSWLNQSNKVFPYLIIV